MTVRAPAGRLLGRCLQIVLGATLLLLLGATGASAHAQVDLSWPATGSTVMVAPTVVTIYFSENVTYGGNAIRVTDIAGRSVTAGRPQHPRSRPDALSVALQPRLAAGSYGVIWRAVSADSHPVSGTFSFGVRARAGPAPNPSAANGSQTVGVLDGLARFTSFTGLAALLGAWFFALVIELGKAEQSSTLAVLRWGWFTCLASTAFAFILGAAYQAGLPLSAALSTSALRDEVDTRYGQLAIARLLVLLLMWPVLNRQADRQHAHNTHFHSGHPPTWLTFIDSAGLSLALLASFSFAEHAGTGTQLPLALLSNTVHLGAAAVWVGGLLVLAVRLRPGAPPPTSLLLTRWSKTALLAVAALAVTGAYQAWRDVGSLPAVAGTAYGRLLFAKVALFVALLAIGNFGRRAVLRALRGCVTATDRSRTYAGLRLSVSAEVAVALGALAATSVLVDVTPGRAAYNPPVAATSTARSLSRPDLSVSLSASTSRPGPTEVRIQAFASDGRPQTLTAAVAALVDDTRRSPTTPFGFYAGRAGATANLDITHSGNWAVSFVLTAQDGARYSGRVTWNVT